MKAPVALLAVFTMLLVPLAQAQDNRQPLHTFSGCLTAANGLLLLQQSAGHAYALHGNTQKMDKYLDHSIQVQGTPEKPRHPKAIGAALQVKSWKVTGECHLDVSSLSRESPAWKKSGVPAVAVPGQAGPEATAAPVTSNRSVGEPTPPSDVERNRVPPPPPAQPGQPPVPEDAGQNPTAANKIAIAAQRAQIGTHNGTLGVPGKPGAGTLASQQSRAHPSAVVKMDGEEFQPAKVTIVAGQTVEWKNTTSDPHTVTLVPDKALVPSDVALPKNAQPFDSGTIPAGMTFVHTFRVPGTYRYYCTLHEGNGMVGEVIVR
ncbi:MAG: plastocyanin/azurin family copper-binding protein [Chlamydiota bacterium]